MFMKENEVILTGQNPPLKFWHNLPLTLEKISSFEKNITECEQNLTEHGVELPIPDDISNAYERYYDSKLPLVTEFLITHCPGMSIFLAKWDILVDLR